MESVVNVNNTSFQVQITEALRSVEHLKNDPARYHQRLVVEYVLKYPHNRGLLVYHKMGSGKTRLAAEITEKIMKEDPSKRVIFISAKTLHENFKGDLRKYMEQSDGEADFSGHLSQKYRFVSMNASNMIQQVYKATQKEGVQIFSDIIEKIFSSSRGKKDTDDDPASSVSIKKFKEEMNKINALENLDGTVVVIDEAHNFFNSVTNGSRNAIMLYYMLLHASNIKILFMTGSPIVNDPFELAVCFNALAGLQDGETLFGDNYNDFINYFVDNTELMDNEKQDIEGDGGDEKRIRYPVIKNKGKFMNRISGLVSYFGADSPEFKKLLPKAEQIVIERVPMSIKQYVSYLIARDKEMEETKRSAGFSRAAAAMQKPGGSSSSYRVMSRQISNFMFPDYASKIYRNEKGQLIYEKHPEQLKDETFDKDELEIYSPKMARLLRNLARHLPKGVLADWKSGPGSGIGPGLVYSQFVESGVEMIATALEHYDMKRISGFSDLIVHKSGSGTYAVISGDTPEDLQNEILKAYNLPENAKGEIISILLVTVKGAEGINLFTCRHEHMYEPFWHYARVEQFFDRAVRPGSLQMLPEKERTVFRYVYLADYPSSSKGPRDALSKDMARKSKEIQSIESTTDVTLYGRAVLNNILRVSYFKALQDGSIDCSVHYDHDGAKCRMCLPTDKPLYAHNLRQDMKLDSPCEPLKKKSVKATSVVVDDREYMYTDDGGLHIFEYDKRIDGYVEVLPGHSDYYDIRKAIKARKK
jgi:hypothetical protein